MASPVGTGRINRFSRRIRSVEAAAAAGVGYSVLATGAILALSRFPDLSLSDEELATWFDDASNQATLVLGLNLAALSSVAFLWFVAVVQRRLGEHDDRFFTMVFQGSSVVLVTVWLIGAAAVAAPAVATTINGNGSIDRTAATVTSGFAAALLYVVAPRIQAVFVFSTSTLIRRTGVLPRWTWMLGYATGAVLFTFPLVTEPLGLALPVWVLILSVEILFKRPTMARSDE